MSEDYKEICEKRKEDIDNILQIGWLVIEVFSGISTDTTAKIATQLYMNEQENKRHSEKLGQDWKISNQKNGGK